MAAVPTAPVPTISPAEIQILISRAGLVLNPGQVADLVLAWRQVAGLIAAMPHGRPLVDDMALTFRLPPPAEVPVGNAPRAARAKSATRPAKATGSPMAGAGSPARASEKTAEKADATVRPRPSSAKAPTATAKPARR